MTDRNTSNVESRRNRRVSHEYLYDPVSGSVGGMGIRSWCFHVADVFMHILCKRSSNPPSQAAEPVLKCGYGSSDERSPGKTTDTSRFGRLCRSCNERHATE
jgi:hypothetical protein